jgi:hypothetical protein
LSPTSQSACLPYSPLGRRCDQRGQTGVGARPSAKAAPPPPATPQGWAWSRVGSGARQLPAPRARIIPSGRAASSICLRRVPRGSRGGDRRKRRAGQPRGGGGACLACQRESASSACDPGAGRLATALRRVADGDPRPVGCPPRSTLPLFCRPSAPARPCSSESPLISAAVGDSGEEEKDGLLCRGYSRPGKTASCVRARDAGEKVATTRQPCE